jgi:hypothetical protein
LQIKIIGRSNHLPQPRCRARRKHALKTAVRVTTKLRGIEAD